jgi:predicted MPP superfamily phosphohydrolase
MALSRRKFLALTAGAVAGSVAATTGYLYANNEAGQPVIEQIQIPLKNLPPALAGLRIVWLSDFHLYPHTELNLLQQAAALAVKLNPDVLILGGDYVTREAEAIFELAPVLANLNARYGVFSIIGNHDIWTNIDVVETGLAEAGIPLLKNEGVALNINNSPLYLAGVDDGWSGQPDLAAAMENQPSNATTVLLAHEPDLADVFSLDPRISLQLSGHSHGGQIRFQGIGAFILPHLGRKYDMGLYRVNDMWLYTNRGLGNVTEPVRYNCPPEVTEIRLVRG